MSDYQIRAGIRALLATQDKDQVPRDQRLALLNLLSDNSLTYGVEGRGRRISEWSNEDGQGNYLHSTDSNFLDGIFSSIDSLDEHLDDFGLPPLREWESYEKGIFATAIIENDDGHNDPEGNFIVDYDIEVRIVFTTPLQPDEIP